MKKFFVLILKIIFLSLPTSNMLALYSEENETEENDIVLSDKIEENYDKFKSKIVELQLITENFLSDEIFLSDLNSENFSTYQWFKNEIIKNQDVLDGYDSDVDAMVVLNELSNDSFKSLFLELTKTEKLIKLTITNYRLTKLINVLEDVKKNWVIGKQHLLILKED